MVGPITGIDLRIRIIVKIHSFVRNLCTIDAGIELSQEIIVLVEYHTGRKYHWNINLSNGKFAKF